jgi:hypothetical protein
MSFSAWAAAAALRRHRVGPAADGEALGADAVGGHAGLQRVFGGADHGVGAADEDLVHARHRQQGLDDLAHLVAVDAALEQVDLLGLARQHVDQREAVAVAVLEVLQGLVEHHRRHAAVAIDQGELGLGLLLEGARGDRQDGRDARAGGKAHAVDRALLPRSGHPAASPGWCRRP